MKTAFKTLMILFGIFVFVIISFITISEFLTKPIPTQEEDKTTTESSKPYKLCISGYYPANYPNYTSTDIKNYFDDVNETSEIYGIHTNYEDLKLIDLSSAYLDPGVSINLVIGTTNNLWRGKAEGIFTKLSQVIDKHNQVRYLGIGNEINNSFEQNSNDYKDFLKTYKGLYTKVKAKYPNLKVYTVFQYELLIGKGYLTGKKTNVSRVSLLNDFMSHSDLIGITTYPFFDYKNPKDVPLTYFQPLEKFKKQIFITETAWPSQPIDNNQDIFNASPTIQVDYLTKIIKIANEERHLANICWLGVNDLKDWLKGNNDLRIFYNLGLKDNKGLEKKIWQSWQGLK